MGIVKNTTIYMSVALINQALMVLLWFVLAWRLNPSEIGVYSLAMFLVDFFGIINIFGLNSAISRFYYSEEKKQKVLFNSLALLFSATALLFPIFWIFTKVLPFLIPEIAGFAQSNFAIFFSCIFIGTLVNFILSHYIAIKRAGTYAFLQFVRTVLFFVLSVILVFWNLGILGVLYGYAVSFLAISILFFVFNSRDILLEKFCIRTAKDILFYSAPLMIYGILGVIVTYFGRIILSRYNNLEILGIYSFFFVINLQINGIWSSFNKAWVPEMFSIFSEDRQKAIKNIEFMAFASGFLYLAGAAFAIMAGELFLFKIIFKEAYLPFRYIFYILLLQPFFTGLYTAFYPLYYYPKKTNLILLISILTSLIDVTATFFMAKYFGMRGAAFSYFFITVFTLFAYLFSFKKIMEIPPRIISNMAAISIPPVLGALLAPFSLGLSLLAILLSLAIIYKKGALYEKKHLLQTFFAKLKASAIKK